MQGRSVLVAEDEYFLADDLAAMLRRAGAEVVGPVATCEQAMTILEKSRRIDVAILDINLRGELVFGIADILIARGTIVVFSTGYPTELIPSRFHGVPVWRKPYRLAALQSSLQTLLQGS